MSKSTVCAIAIAMLGTGASAASAAALTQGNLIVYRVGDGSASLATTGNPVFLDEYTPSGSLVQTIATGIYGNPQAGTDSFLTLSKNGQYIMFSGFDSQSSSGAIPANTNVKKVVGRLSLAGVVQTNVLSGDTYAATTAGNSLRGVVSLDGSQFWTAGTNSGIRYGTWGSNTTSDVYAPGGTSTTLAPSKNNIRTLSIAGGQLYGTAQMFDNASAPVTSATRVFTVGTGTPTGSASITNLVGFPLTSGTGTSNTSPWQMVALDRDGSPGIDTIYLADAGSGTTGTAAGLGIQKWSFSTSTATWVYNGTVATGSTANSAAIGAVAYYLSADVRDGGVTLYASTAVGTSAVNAGISGGILYSLSDTSGFNSPINGTLTSLTSIPTSTQKAFRGLVYLPEPTTLTLLASVVTLVGRRQRR